MIGVEEGAVDGAPDYEFTELPGGYLSASRVGKYLTCAESFRRTYVKGKRFIPNARMALGSTVHKIVELTLEEVKSNGKLPPQEYMMDHSSSAFAACFADVEDMEGETEEHYQGLTTDLCNLWYKTLAPGIVPLGIEESFEVNIAGAKVIGFIDLIDGANNAKTVVDLKVVKRAKREYDAKNSIQLGIYSLATGISNVGFDSLVKTVIPSAKAVRSELTPSDRAWIGEIVRSVAEGIMAGVFPKAAPDSWVCSEKFCDHYSECRGSSTFVPVSAIR